jgi:hypothetical protein
MKHKEIKIALILGPLTLVILGFCAFQQGILFRSETPVTQGDVPDKSFEEAQIELLQEMSGNKDYDSWSPERKAQFQKEQVELLESLR